MKILLFSDQVDYFSNTQQTFLKSKLSGKRIAYIPSKTDTTRSHFSDTEKFYKNYEVEALLYLDLDEEYLPDNDGVLEAVDAIHLSGGRITEFAATLYKRGYDTLIREFMLAGKLLIGVSAGAIIMGPNLSIAEIYERVKTKDRPEGLNFFNFVFAPHSERLAKELQDFKQNYEIMPCRDDEIIYIEDGKRRLID